MCTERQEQIALCCEVERGLEALRRTEAAVAQVKRDAATPPAPVEAD